MLVPGEALDEVAKASDGEAKVVGTLGAANQALERQRGQGRGWVLLEHPGVDALGVGVPLGLLRRFIGADLSDEPLHRASRSNEALVRAAAAGKDAAMEQLLMRVQSVAFRFSLLVCGDPHDAEDVMQEALRW